MDFATAFTKILAILTVIGNISFLVLVIAIALDKGLRDTLSRYANRFIFPLGTLVTGGATIGSMLYSEVVGFPACILCWTQRILIYPQMLLFGLAWYRKERTIIPYVFFLSLLGALVATYHWVKDMLLVYRGMSVPCPAVSSLPSCDKIYVLEFGYVTIAMLSLNAFLWLLLLAWLSMRHKSVTQ